MSGVFSWRNLIRQNYKTALFASLACFLCTKYNNYEAYRSNEKLYKNYDRYFTRFCNSLMSPFSIKCYALTKKQREQLMTKQTDVYVWGNGYQVDFSLDYNNFFPKKISNFDGEGKPQIIMVKFGLFHEAYLDKTGKIHLCSKHKLPSMKIPNQDDRFRSDMATLEVKGRKVIDMCFTDKSGTQGRLFALTDKGEVFVWKIDYILPNDFKQKGGFIHNDIINEYEVAVMKEPIHITELKNIEQIVSGSDHFLALDKNGEVWAMGDDTFGQCGQEAGNRPEVPPFKEKRISKPTKVRLPAKAVKIASGYRHSFAISTNGELYGWGYNNQQQLSHSEEFAAETTPKHVIFEPTKITKEIESRRVVDVAGGKDFFINSY